MMFQVQKNDNPNEQLLVTFPDEKPVGVKYLKMWGFFFLFKKPGNVLCYVTLTCLLHNKSLCQRMMDSKVNRGIIVFPGTLTAAANKVTNVHIYTGSSYLNNWFTFCLFVFVYIGNTSYKHKRD